MHLLNHLFQCRYSVLQKRERKYRSHLQIVWFVQALGECLALLHDPVFLAKRDQVTVCLRDVPDYLGWME